MKISRWRALREWVLREVALWRDAWIRHNINGCDYMILSPDRYTALLEAAEREKICHVQLGEAQETIRVLRATVARQDELITLQQSAMERETQALIDRMPEREQAKSFF